MNRIEIMDDGEFAEEIREAIRDFDGGEDEMTFDEALERAKRYDDRFDSCTEYESGWHFYEKDSDRIDGGGFVVLREGGTVPWSAFGDEYEITGGEPIDLKSIYTLDGGEEFKYTVPPEYKFRYQSRDEFHLMPPEKKD